MTHDISTILALVALAPVRSITLRVGAFGIHETRGVEGSLIVRRDIGTALRAHVARADMPLLVAMLSNKGHKVLVTRS